jgi:hypothetical protein
MLSLVAYIQKTSFINIRSWACMKAYFKELKIFSELKVHTISFFLLSYLFNGAIYFLNDPIIL